MKQQSTNLPHQADKKPAPARPVVGAPLDGSQYQNIVEEQKYSGQRPTPEEQQPREASPAKKK